MSFLITCIFYAFIGCTCGFFVHIFNGLIQTKIQFDAEYIRMTFFNFLKTIFIMTLSSIFVAMIIIIIPNSFYNLIGVEMVFLQQLMFYLIAFASFDFGLQN